MGGLIAVHVAFRDPGAWAAVVLSGPALELDPRLTTPLLRRIAPIVSKHFPKLAVRSLDPDLISGNRPIVELAKQDPFRFSVPLTARYGAEMMRAIDDVWENMERSTFPLLIVHGSRDLLCAVSGGWRGIGCVLCAATAGGGEREIASKCKNEKCALTISFLFVCVWVQSPPHFLFLFLRRSAADVIIFRLHIVPARTHVFFPFFPQDGLPRTYAFLRCFAHFFFCVGGNWGIKNNKNEEKEQGQKRRHRG
ncbi:monoglyceride lipase, putative, partial [Trypanosoma cruzi marinkellei]